MCPARRKVTDTPGGDLAARRQPEAVSVFEHRLGIGLGEQRQGGACFENPLRLAYAASSSCRCPASGSTIRQSRSSPGVA